MEIVQKKPEKLILRMEANETIANAIRRSVAEVPTLAIDEVEIYRNDSAIYDEMLAHRIGLVPLKTEKSMNSKTKVEFKLSKMGPGTVYSSELKGSADVVEDKIPLTILGNNHKLELTATAILGKGIEHAKYIPGLCYYRHLKEITSSKEIDAIVQNSKSSIVSEKKGSKWICDLSEADIDSILKINSESVKDSGELIFIVESFGQMDAKDIFLKAIDAIEENLDIIEKAVK